MKLINLFTLLTLCVSQVYSAAPEQAYLATTEQGSSSFTFFPQEKSDNPDPFVSVPDAKPFKINLKTDVTEEFKEKAKKLINCTIKPENLRICGSLVLSSQGYSAEEPLPNFHEWSKTTIVNGSIIQNGDTLSSDDTLWALNHMGDLRIYPIVKYSFENFKRALPKQPHHSHFFQDDKNIGLPVACAGHMKIKDGKIIMINRDSGHYVPTAIQLVLAVSYLNDRGVIDGNIVLDEGPHSSGFSSLVGLLSFASMIELG